MRALFRSMPGALACALVLALVTCPAEAIAPLVMVARQIVQQMIKNFVEGQIDGAIRSSFGPCKSDLAEDAIQRRRQLTGMIGGVGGALPMNIPGMGNMSAMMQGARSAAGGTGGANAMGGLSNIGGAASALNDPRLSGAAQAAGRAEKGLQTAQEVSDKAAQVSNAADRIADTANEVSGGASPITGAAGMPAMASGLAGMPGRMAGGPMGGMPIAAGGGGGLAGLAAGVPGMPSSMPGGAAMPNGMDMQAMMAKMQEMMSGPPLSPAEFDELVDKLERFGKVSEAVNPGTGCSADDYRRLLSRTMVSSNPQARQMSAGMMRMLYSTFKDMDQKFEHSSEIFAQMSPQERAEYVDTIGADLKNGPPQARRAFGAMLDNGLLRPPEDMAAALRARIAD